MKKNFYFAFLGAFALTGVLGISSCSSDNEIVEVNPTFDPAKNEVTTQFVLNVNPSEQGTTRQAATTVQKAKNFRGMKEAKLIGLSTGKANTFLAPFLGNSTGFDVKRTYDLGTLYANGSVDNDPESDNAENSSHRVVELTLPLKTDAMLVYGRAIPVTKASGTSTVTDEEENGSVVYNVDATPENTTFELVARMADPTAYTQCCQVAAAILNLIMLSQVDAHNDMTNPITRVTNDTSTDPATVIGSYTQEAALPALTWREIGIKTDAEIALLAPLQQNLAKAYSVIRSTYMSTDAVNSGSAASLCKMMKDVYTIASTVSGAVATSDDELNAQLLADEIKSRIEAFFIRDNAAFPFRQIGDAETGNSILRGLSEAGVNVTGFTAVNDNNFPTFPKSFNLPDGVAQLDFTDFTTTDAGTSGGFAYKATGDNASLINIGTKLNPTKYMYPSELLYFDNSLLRVTDAEKKPGDYPDGYNKWDNDSWTGWTTGPVTSGTRSVAVKNNINYGVAMLETTVAIDNTVTTGFKDNRPAEEQVTLSAAQIGNFILTGVLIGGQYKQVGWNYLTKSVADENKDFVIYDNKMASNGATISASTATPNYTLVFDNYSTAGQGNVLVALEFKNGNDVDIYGKGGIIPKGATFYLAAELELGSKTISTWPTTYAIPPYSDAGASQKITRIFTQDYVTTATFKIGENSLKNAYTTVPDLRATQTSLGLSVDLNWRQGLSFETVLGK